MDDTLYKRALDQADFLAKVMANATHILSELRGEMRKLASEQAALKREVARLEARNRFASDPYHPAATWH